MIAIQIMPAQLNLTDHPAGGKIIEFMDPNTDIRVGVHLGDDEVERLRAGLSGVHTPGSGLEVPPGVVRSAPTPPPGGGGAP